MKFKTRLGGLVALVSSLWCWDAARCPTWPTPSAAKSFASMFGGRGTGGERAGAERDELPDVPVCIASQAWSAGDLGSIVLYHTKRVGSQLHVGYFVYWSTERPWGKNLLSYLVVPALVVDSFYSHLFFLFPGLQRVLHGPGDIEGARVVYEQREGGRWAPVSAVADDGTHHEVALAPEDFVDDKGRVILMTNVWSHQLGAKGARAFAEDRRDGVVCFEHERLAPMTASVAESFRLGSPSEPRRAPPAWRL